MFNQRSNLWALLVSAAFVSVGCGGGSVAGPGVSASVEGSALPGETSTSTTLAAQASGATSTSTTDSTQISTSTTTAAVSTSTEQAESTTTAPAVTSTTSAPLIPQDAEPGLQYDIGSITEMQDIEGTKVISFDRFQVYNDNGDLVSGTELSTEFSLGASTDWPFVNENPKLRSYPLAPSVATFVTSDEWLDGQDDFCGGDGSKAGDPEEFTPAPLESAIGGPVVSLTFNEYGWVSAIKVMLGC